MEYQIIDSNNQRVIECLPGKVCLRDEQDALDWVGICGENETYLLMIHASNLTPDFYDLKTGTAGRILLKFSNYSLKVAAVIPAEIAQRGRFGEMVLETNRVSREFRVFADREDAENWLIQTS